MGGGGVALTGRVDDLYVRNLVPGNVGSTVASPTTRRTSLTPIETPMLSQSFHCKPATEGGLRVSVLKQQEGAPVLLG